MTITIVVFDVENSNKVVDYRPKQLFFKTLLSTIHIMRRIIHIAFTLKIYLCTHQTPSLT